MICIELDERQMRVARWVIQRLERDLREDTQEWGLPDFLHLVPTIQGRTLLIAEEKMGEVPVAEALCAIVDWDFEEEGHFEFGFTTFEPYRRAGRELYQAISATARAPGK